MTPPPLEREAVLPRIDGIRKNIKKLTSLSKQPFNDFASEDSFDLAQHHLRLALEGIFHISSHILSRLPGGRATEYKEIATKMGELKIVPEEFSKQALIPMAGMRNILVHHYADIKPERLYDILKNHLQDIEQFLHYIKKFLEHPEKHQLSIK
ncbi:MAG: DUF86 domain-containing protein [Deltaproteobacteria bacterium]|nr:DUF86 domain-containing protein [Deltaproteobacteria bacterium]